MKNTKSRNIKSHDTNYRFAMVTIMIMMFAVSGAFSQSGKHSADEVFGSYEKNLYHVSTWQIKYPDMTYYYNYDDKGKLESVTITGIENSKDRDALRIWLTNLQTLSSDLLYKKDQNGIYYKAEENARPLQGKHEFYKELKQNIDYPKEAKRQGIEGVVNLKFIVDRFGLVENLQASADFEAPEYIKKEMVFEAKRAFRNTEQGWEPGEIHNFEVSQWIVLPVSFQLEQANPLPRTL